MQLRTLLSLWCILVLVSVAYAGRDPLPRKDGRAPLLGTPKNPITCDDDHMCARRTDDANYIVMLHSTASEADLDDVINLCACISSPGFERFSAIGKGFLMMDVSTGTVEAVRNHPAVEYVEHEMILHKDNLATTQILANQPEGNLQYWGLDRIDQLSPNGDGKYEYNLDGTGVHIYVMDTGVRATHNEFQVGKIDSVSFINGQTGDCYKHGTLVASVAGGRTCGVAKNAFLHDIKIWGCDGDGPSSGVLRAFEYIVKNVKKPAVVNTSWRNGVQSVYDATLSVLAAGITLVAASGNEGASVCNVYPAQVPGVITVGASDITDKMTAFTNHGPCMSIIAPGDNIQAASPLSDTDTVYAGGTSLATPFVTGVAALYLQKYPDASPAEVKAALIQGALKNVLNGVPAGAANVLLNTRFLLSNGQATPTPTNGATPSPSSPSIKLTLNGGSNQWWIGVTLSGETVATAKLELKDASSSAAWTAAKATNYGAWEFPASAPVTVPISVRLTSSTGVVLVLTNLITDLSTVNIPIDTHANYGATPSQPTGTPTATPTSTPSPISPSASPTPTPSAGPLPTVKPSAAPSEGGQMTVNSGSGKYWFAVEVRFTQGSTTTVDIQDAGFVSSWTRMEATTWSYFTFSPSREIVFPVKVRATSSSGGTLTFTVPTLSPGSVFSPSA